MDISIDIHIHRKPWLHSVRCIQLRGILWPVTYFS